MWTAYVTLRKDHDALRERLDILWKHVDSRYPVASQKNCPRCGRLVSGANLRVCMWCNGRLP